MNKTPREAHRRSAYSKAGSSGEKSIAETARIHHTSRMTIYRWLKRYDGTLNSLARRSHRPRPHPNEHTARLRSHRKTLGAVCLYEDVFI